MPGQEEWSDVGGAKLVKWDEARVLEGVFQSQGEVTGQYGKQMKGTLLQDDGETVEFYEPAILKRILTDGRVKQGVRIRIEYTGKSEKTTGGRLAKSFKVQIKA